MINIADIFNKQQLVAEILKTLPPLHTHVLDNVYSTTRQHPFAHIGIQEIQGITGSVPIVRRGAPGVPVGQQDMKMDIIEPHPIKVYDTISAVDANNLKSMGTTGYRAFLASKLDVMRRKIRATTEALAAQSLTGKISYPARLENGQTATYEIDFGSTFSYTPTTTWDSGSITDILGDLINIESIIQRQGYGQSLKIWAGKDAYLAAAAKAEAVPAGQNASIPVKVTEKGINIAGYTIELVNQFYYMPDGTTKPVIDPKSIVVFDASAGFTLYYLAIDDFKAGLQALPLFTKSFMSEDGTALKVQAESKPLPVPVVKAICEAQVLN